MLVCVRLIDLISVSHFRAIFFRNFIIESYIHAEIYVLVNMRMLSNETQFKISYQMIVKLVYQLVSIVKYFKVNLRVYVFKLQRLIRL